MPEERLSGILVDPMGDAKPINKEEYGDLKICLEMLRTYNPDADFRGALRWMFNSFETEALQHRRRVATGESVGKEK